MSQTKTMEQLLDQYAQEAGFVNLLDLKNSYTDRAYAATMQSLVRRARAELQECL